MAAEVQSFGVLILDPSGRTRFKSGVAQQREVAKAAVAAALGGKGRPRRMQTLVVGSTRFIMLALGADDATALVLHRCDDEDATVFDFAASVDFAFAIIRHLLRSPFEAVTVVDAEGVVRYVCPVHEHFFGLAPGEAVGRPVTEIIENTRLHHVARTGKAEIGQVQEMRGVRRVVRRFPIVDGGKVVGAIGQVMFKEPDQLHEMSREIAKLKNQVAFYKRELSGLRNRNSGLDQIIGTSDAIRQLKSDIAKVAALDVPVLLVGESGTGKELAASALHGLNARRQRQMVLVNASALPANLVESELFGYEPGAFTGAGRKGRRGKFELADRSTLFLDEIGDMPVEVQPKLLRVLQDGTFERVGGDQLRYSDFRLITATNRDLKEMVAERAFRLDLFYRISGVTLKLPALRDRLEDIPALVQHFIETYSTRHRRKIRYVHKDALAWLQQQEWPGNVRELLHELDRAAIFCEGSELTLDDFRPPAQPAGDGSVVLSGNGRSTIRAVTENVELSMIREAMTRHNGNKTRVAGELGISRAYLYKRLQAISV